VWPKQESTSQLDAAAAGLPIVLSGRVTVTERVAGNGITYAEGDSADLAERIRSLQSATLRRELGAAGTQKMNARFSWLRIARQRSDDYSESLGRQARNAGLIRGNGGHDEEGSDPGS
jgi:glycosyltransferase involved in cell wall biosynthesis